MINSVSPVLSRRVSGRPCWAICFSPACSGLRAATSSAVITASCWEEAAESLSLTEGKMGKWERQPRETSCRLWGWTGFLSRWMIRSQIHAWKWLEMGCRAATTQAWIVVMFYPTLLRTPFKNSCFTLSRMCVCACAKLFPLANPKIRCRYPRVCLPQPRLQPLQLRLSSPWLASESCVQYVVASLAFLVVLSASIFSKGVGGKFVINIHSIHSIRSIQICSPRLMYPGTLTELGAAPSLFVSTFAERSCAKMLQKRFERTALGQVSGFKEPQSRCSSEPLPYPPCLPAHQTVSPWHTRVFKRCCSKHAPATLAHWFIGQALASVFHASQSLPAEKKSWA